MGSDGKSHLKGRDIQDGAKEHDIEWRLHLPQNLQAAGFVERTKGVLKQQMKLLTSKIIWLGGLKYYPRL